MKNENTKKKVLLGMSGGVDSSVAAILLLEQGYDVTGAFMKQWSDTKEISGVCSWKEDRRDAMRVAAHLGIPLITLDFEKEYNEWVMGYMFQEYEAGRTPNPDVMCNKFIKFGTWLDTALEMGFDYLATGHYAIVTSALEHLSTRAHVLLMQAKDENKDQTYFLHQLRQEQLKHVLFPLGPYTKQEVREIARKHTLPNAERAESMGICFVGEVSMKDFLQQKIGPKNGKMILHYRSGAEYTEEVIGEHDGLSFYTIGQRHIGTIFNEQFSKIKKQQEGDTRPLYVVEKRLDTNELIVGYEDDPLLYKKEIEVTDVNWIRGQMPDFPLDCEVRLRHRQELQKAQVTSHISQIIITFEHPQRAVTPGQFAVFYKDGECLGGGIIA